MSVPVLNRFDSLGVEGGPSLTIGWSEPADSTFRWTLQLDVRLEDWYRAGPIYTVPPQGPLAPQGVAYRNAASNRVIATAFFPGARAWRLQGRAIQTDVQRGSPRSVDARAELSLTTDLAGGFSLGLHAVDAWETGPEGLQLPPTAGQVFVPASPASQQIVLDDPTRQSLELSATTAIYLGGDASVLSTTGFLLPAGAIFRTRSRRSVWATSAVGSVATWWSENR